MPTYLYALPFPSAEARMELRLMMSSLWNDAQRHSALSLLSCAPCNLQKRRSLLPRPSLSSLGNAFASLSVTRSEEQVHQTPVSTCQGNWLSHLDWDGQRLAPAHPYTCMEGSTPSKSHKLLVNFHLCQGSLACLHGRLTPTHGSCTCSQSLCHIASDLLAMSCM